MTPADSRYFLNASFCTLSAMVAGLQGLRGLAVSWKGLRKGCKYIFCVQVVAALNVEWLQPSCSEYVGQKRQVSAKTHVQHACSTHLLCRYAPMLRLKVECRDCCHSPPC